MAYSISELKFADKITPKTLEDIAKQQAQKWIEGMRSELAKKDSRGFDKVSTGQLSASLVPQVKIAPTYAQITIEGEGYWKNVEYGRAKGKKGVPITAIRKFMYNRGIKGKEFAKAKNKENYLNGLAFVIQRSIKKNGIEPKYFVKNTITKESISEFKKALLKGIKKGLK